MREAKNSQAEVDYLVESNRFGILPVEVKSGSASKLRSLHLFMENSPANTAIRFWNNPERKDLIALPGGKKFTLFSLPFYYAGFIEPFLEARM